MQEMNKTYLRIFLQIEYQKPEFTTMAQALSQSRLSGLQELRRKFG